MKKLLLKFAYWILRKYGQNGPIHKLTLKSKFDCAGRIYGIDYINTEINAYDNIAIMEIKATEVVVYEP